MRTLSLFLFCSLLCGPIFSAEEGTVSVTEFVLNDGTVIIAKRFISAPMNGETNYMVTLMDGKSIQVSGATVASKNTKKIALETLSETHAKAAVAERENVKTQLADSAKRAELSEDRRKKIQIAANKQYESGKARNVAQAQYDAAKTNHERAVYCIATTPGVIEACQARISALKAAMHTVIVGTALQQEIMQRHNAGLLSQVNKQIALVQEADLTMTRAKLALPELEEQLARARLKLSDAIATNETAKVEYTNATRTDPSK